MKPKDQKYKAAIDMYDQEDQENVMTLLKEYCQFFGYFHPQDEEANPYSGFALPETLKKSPPESEYCQYKKENELTLQWNTGLSEAERKERTFEIKGKMAFSNFGMMDKPVSIRDPFTPDQ